MRYSFLIFLFVLFVGCASDNNLDNFEDDNTHIENPDRGGEDLSDVIRTPVGDGFYIHNPEIYEGYHVSYIFDAPQRKYVDGHLRLFKVYHDATSFNNYQEVAFEATLTFKWNGSKWNRDVKLILQFYDYSKIVKYSYPITLSKGEVEKERVFTIIFNE